jgi:tRNA(Ile)-lysidine synthase
MDLEPQVRAEELLRPQHAVVVLLSGGRDSVCLLDLAARIAGAGAVSALHVNYGLRDSAAGDEQFCRELCERVGVELSVHRPPRPEGNLQAWARDQRYTQAARLALERGAEVAAGHTATDQVETVLYRLAASPGRRALLGMRPRDGRLVRPLLGIWREQVTAHCLQRGLEWREDPSNESVDFARNRARHGLVAELRRLHPAAEENVLRTIELLRDEAAVLDAAVAVVLDEAGDPPAVAALAALPPALARLAVQELADRAGEGRAPAVGPRTEEILGLGAAGALDVGGGLRALVRDGRLSFVPTPPRGGSGSGVVGSAI